MFVGKMRQACLGVGMEYLEQEDSGRQAGDQKPGLASNGSRIVRLLDR
jgi:hypothetical protein